jgi:quercetin dioxygenase-like cupin family protein
VTSPITRKIVLDVTLPAVLATARVEARTISMLPATAAGLHLHNGPVFGNVVAGSVVYQIDGEPAATLTAGDAFYEPEGARIARFDATDEGVTFLAYYLLGDGEQAEITFPES